MRLLIDDENAKIAQGYYNMITTLPVQDIQVERCGFRKWEMRFAKPLVLQLKFTPINPSSHYGGNDNRKYIEALNRLMERIGKKWDYRPIENTAMGVLS